MGLSWNSRQLQVRSPTVAVTLTARGKIVQCALILCALTQVFVMHLSVCRCMCVHILYVRVYYVIYLQLFVSTRAISEGMFCHARCVVYCMEACSLTMAVTLVMCHGSMFTYNGSHTRDV